MPIFEIVKMEEEEENKSIEVIGIKIKDLFSRFWGLNWDMWLLLASRIDWSTALNHHEDFSPKTIAYQYLEGSLIYTWYTLTYAAMLTQRE